MKAEERFADRPGQSIGTLAAINTLGAILGALAAGFLLLEWLGLWRSIQWIAAVYLLAGLLIPAAKTDTSRVFKAVSGVMLVLVFTVFGPARLPASWTKDPLGEQETLLEKWEGSDSTVTVVRGFGQASRRSRSTRTTAWDPPPLRPQIFQARIPLLAFPATDSVFFLGMGTGITAGEALDRDSYPDVGQVVACELSPRCGRRIEKYFAGGTGQRD
jgi:spermidine synthase